MIKSIKEHFIRERITYTGQELRSHWIMSMTGVMGDAIVAFQGPADVPTSNMVDLMDVQDDAPIASRHMLHFIVEHFGITLSEAVWRQHLLMAIIGEELRRHAKVKKLERRGDDLYDGERKLSVSIAAPSPVSCCIHAGLNIDADGAPVRAIGLSDYGIDATRFAPRVMKRYVHECSQIAMACCKVRAIP